MNRCRVGRGFLAALTVAAIIASCGGSDSGGDDGAAPDPVDTTTSASATDDTSGVADSATDDSSDGATDESPSGGETTNCDAIFSTAEVEAFFAEPAVLTEETNDSIGQLVCSWDSIEDPDDTEDLAFKTLIVQVYSGDPIPAANFFDPSIFESVTTIEGIGDLAYTADDLGPSFYFVDEPVGGTLSYSELDMGNVDAPKLHTLDDVEQLFRTFHDRVT